MDFKVIRDAKGNLIEDVTLEPYTITKSDNEKDIESVLQRFRFRTCGMFRWRHVWLQSRGCR